MQTMDRRMFIKGGIGAAAGTALLGMAGLSLIHI